MASSNQWVDQSSTGLYSFPAAAPFLSNETQATQETPYGNGTTIYNSGTNPFTGTTIGNLINNLTGNPNVDSLGQDTSQAGYSSVFGKSDTGILSGFTTWFETGIADASIRIGVVILGFILVAAGLSMFKNGEIKLEIKR